MTTDEAHDLARLLSDKGRAIYKTLRNRIADFREEDRYGLLAIAYAAQKSPTDPLADAALHKLCSEYRLNLENDDVE